MRATFPSPTTALQDLFELGRNNAPKNTPENRAAYMAAEAKTVALFKGMKALYDIEPPAHGKQQVGGVTLPKPDAMFGYAEVYDAIQAAHMSRTLSPLAHEVRQRQRLAHDELPDQVRGMPDRGITSPFSEGPRKALRRKVLQDAYDPDVAASHLLHMAQQGVGEEVRAPVSSRATLDVLQEAAALVCTEMSATPHQRQWAGAMRAWVGWWRNEAIAAERAGDRTPSEAWKPVDQVGRTFSRWLMHGEALPDGAPPMPPQNDPIVGERPRANVV